MDVRNLSDTETFAQDSRFKVDEAHPLIVNEIIEFPEASNDVNQKEVLPFWRLIALTICFLGVQFGWAVQIAYSSPIFLELGVPKFAVSLVWLAGPISGLLVQPTIGVISDSCNLRWGRRRPFILVGAIFIVVGMLLISNAKDIGRLIGRDAAFNAITTAIIGFWILDLSNNTVQGPCRALLVDLAPASQQNLGGSLFSFMMGTGNLLGYFVGSLHLTKWLPFMKTDLRALFTIGIFVLIFCVAITIIFAKEISYNSTEKPKKNPFGAILKGILTMPKGMIRICAVQFFAWFAWFTFILYITTWVGENVFNGNPGADPSSVSLLKFQEGVRCGALGLTIFAAVTTVCSIIFPILSRYLGIKPIFFVCQLVLGACLLSTLWINSKEGALVIIAACGIPWTAVMIFPFAVVAMSVEESESGMYMGVLNIFVVIPQILVAVGIGFVINIFDGDLVSALVSGAISAFLSSILVWTLVLHDRTPIEILPGFDAQ